MCEQCSPGSVSGAGAEACTPCPAGTFSAKTSGLRTQCSACPPGLQSEAEQERCCAPFDKCETKRWPSLFSSRYDNSSTQVRSSSLPPMLCQPLLLAAV